MNYLVRVVLAGIVGAAASVPSHADEHRKGEIENTVGPMSEPVLRARLKSLGYTDIKIQKTNTLRYQIEATRNGKPISMLFHPQTGQMVELNAEKKPSSTWHMRLEPGETGLQKPKG
jgi:hypothetical protein